MWRVHTCNTSVTRCSMWCTGFFGWNLEKSPLKRDSLPVVDNTLLEPPDFSWCYLILLDKHIVPAQKGRRWLKFLTDPKCGIYFQLLHPLPKPSRRNLSRILAFMWPTWTIPGVKYASFPLSFLCDKFFPGWRPKPDKEPSILPTSKQMITVSQRGTAGNREIFCNCYWKNPKACLDALAWFEDGGKISIQKLNRMARVCEKVLVWC